MQAAPKSKAKPNENFPDFFMIIPLCLRYDIKYLYYNEYTLNVNTCLLMRKRRSLFRLAGLFALIY